MESEFLAKIVKINLRHNFLQHLFAAIGIVILTPVIFETSSLDGKLAAQPLEMFLCLSGAILFTPIFLPEQDENIRDLIRSKRTNYLAVCAVRFACLRERGGLAAFFRGICHSFVFGGAWFSGRGYFRERDCRLYGSDDLLYCKFYLKGQTWKFLPFLHVIGKRGRKAVFACSGASFGCGGV